MKSLVVVSLLLVASCNGRFEHGPTTGSTSSSAFVSNGERIYFTGSSASGTAISAIGGSGMTGMHQQVHGGGCASCHGADREGQRLWPQFWIEAPALTAAALFESDAHDTDTDGHGEHDSYDDESLRAVITRGIDPAGDRLDEAMPRWSMSPSDLNDLIAYLKQSHDHD